jgi:hypothetical protein
MRKPKNMDERLAVVDFLLLALSELPHYDRLHGRLAQYAAWCLDNSRLQAKFHELLQELPPLSSRMMDTLSPANEAPWNIKLPKCRAPSYDARTFSFGENNY